MGVATIQERSLLARVRYVLFWIPATSLNQSPSYIFQIDQLCHLMTISRLEIWTVNASLTCRTEIKSQNDLIVNRNGKGANRKFSVGLWGVGDLIFNNKPLIKLANSVVYNSILMVLSCFWLPTTLILPILLKVYYWKSNHPPLITLQRIFGLPPLIWEKQSTF